MKQIVEVINELKEWEKVHTPYDRTTRLNLFQFVIEEGDRRETCTVIDRA